MPNNKSAQAGSGQTEESSRLVVVNNYQWIGNPRAAGFTVYIDGRRVGVAPLGDSLTAVVTPGGHVLRVRFGWFLSPRVATDIEPGETREFSADILRKLPVWRRMVHMLNPFAALSLEETGGQR